MPTLLLAVAVGSAAARAGLFDCAGKLLGTASHDFSPLRPAPDQVVYRMDAIWDAVGEAIRATLRLVPDAAGQVTGLGFSATTALVIEHDGPPLLAGDADVFAVSDQRAQAEAAEINATQDPYLASAGGAVTAAMHLPRLLWLRRRSTFAWARVSAARDLCDELAHRATGIDAASLGCLAMQWPYAPDGAAQPGWRQGLLERIGLDDLPVLGALSAPPRRTGQMQGPLSPKVAASLALPAGIPVAAGVTDAAATALGVLGRGVRARINATLVLNLGDPMSFLAFAPDERRIDGVRGPYCDAVLPGYWLHVVEQPGAGAALDAVLLRHTGGPGEATEEAHAAAVADVLALLASEGAEFAAHCPVAPGEPGTGSGRRAFLEAYYVAARALVLRARRMIERLNANGYAITRVALTGAAVRNRLLVRLCRDALGADLVLTLVADAELLGTAMVAAAAARVAPDLFIALDLMSSPHYRFAADPVWRRAHDITYRRCFEEVDSAVRTAVPNRPARRRSAARKRSRIPGPLA